MRLIFRGIWGFKPKSPQGSRSVPELQGLSLLGALLLARQYA